MRVADRHRPCAAQFCQSAANRSRFWPAHVLTASISLPHAAYKDNKSVANFYDRILSQIRTTPGVLSAGAGSDLPWTGWDENTGGFTIQGETLRLSKGSTRGITRRRLDISMLSEWSCCADACLMSMIDLMRQGNDH